LREDTEKLGKVEKKKMKGMQQVEMLSQSFSSLLKPPKKKYFFLSLFFGRQFAI
jgi:hypothetical protein